MAEKVTKDTGMMQRTEIIYRFDNPEDADAMPNAFKAWADTFPVACPGDWLGDALRRHNAERCRDILETAGLSDDGKCVVNTGPLRQKGLAENSAQWLAAHWLAEYNALMRGRERFESGDTTPDDLSRMLMAAEELGRLQERMWWRRGIDPETGKRREELAIGKREQEKAIPRATEARRVQAQDARPDWHDNATLDALEIRRRHPSYSRWRIAGEIHEKFGVSRNRCDKVLRANGIK